MLERSLHKEELIYPGKMCSMDDLADYSEEELLGQVKKGNKQAYQLIVTRYMKSAYYVALGLLHNHQDALDVSQDAFIRAYRKRKAFDPERPFFPWFYRLLRNLCIDYIKKFRRSDEVPLEGVPLVHSDPEDRDMKRALWRGIEELPFENREIIILRYFRQMSYQEIAEVTGKPLGTVMSSLFYAKRKLRDIIKKYFDWD